MPLSHQLLLRGRRSCGLHNGWWPLWWAGEDSSENVAGQVSFEEYLFLSLLLLLLLLLSSSSLLLLLIERNSGSITKLMRGVGFGYLFFWRLLGTKTKILLDHPLCMTPTLMTWFNCKTKIVVWTKMKKGVLWVTQIHFILCWPCCLSQESEMVSWQKTLKRDGKKVTTKPNISKKGTMKSSG